MKSIWKTKRMGSTVLPERRRLNFRSAQELIMRRRRLRQKLAATLAALIGLGMLFIES